MVWLPGLIVALGAAVATSHGLFEVAVAARVPAGIAWLYPLITDGLALVAYTATARLVGSAARYAWSVVVVAAGLSGLAQAAYLAGDGPTVEVAPALRFGVGAWPAIAAAVVAHLLYLLATEHPDDADTVATRVHPPRQAEAPFSGSPLQGPGVQAEPYGLPAVQPASDPRSGQPEPDPGPGDATSPARPAPSPARDRAEAAATRHAQRLGAWPTVTELEAAAEVSRGTAAAALKTLRERPLPLHLINTTEHEPANTTEDEVQQ